jgi:hypothetical protein
MGGQIVGKVAMTALAVPVVWWVRRDRVVVVPALA